MLESAGEDFPLFEIVYRCNPADGPAQRRATDALRLLETTSQPQLEPLAEPLSSVGEIESLADRLASLGENQSS